MILAAIPTRGCKEPSWHRNLRKERQRARGLIAASKIGIQIPPHIIEQALQVLAPHHATDPHRIQSWTLDQKIHNLQSQISDLCSAHGKGGYAAGGSKAKGKGKGYKGTKGGSKGAKAGKGWGHAGVACYRCGDLDHAPHLCPILHLGAVCKKCSKGGHTEQMCKDKAGSQLCGCCGKAGHHGKACSNKGHMCITCNKTGHMDHM